MIQTPYKVYYNTRPLRICYLLDIKKTTSSDIKKIISYCYRLWGGRFNPIILTDGETISYEDWEFLKSYDPDYIKSNVNLSVDIIANIEKELCPYFIYVPNKDEVEFDPHISEFPASISICPGNIKQLGDNYFSAPTISLFNTGFTKIENDDLFQFLAMNFSTYDNTLMDEIALGDNPKELFIVKDKKSIIASLEVISNGNKKVFQSQLCSLSCSVGEPEIPEDKEFGFSIVIGDSVKDLINFWNRIFHLSDFQKTNLRQIWLPFKVAKDEGLFDSIRNFIKKYSYESWQQYNTIKFESTSIQEDDLKEIATILTKGLNSINVIKNCDNIKLPKLSNSLYHYRIQENNYYKIYDFGDTFEVETPKYISDPSNHHKWAIDLFIEYNSKRFENYSGKDFWLQLPKRNWILSNLINIAARINSNGFITVLPGGKSPKIKLNLYDDHYFFNDLIVENHRDYYPSSDPRNTLKRHLFKDIKISDKGDSLTGILDLFSGLFNAHNYLSERYWRNVFDLMTNRKKVMNENRADEIKGIILEKFQNVDSVEDFKESKINFLQNLVMKYSTSMMRSNIEICYDTFEKLAKEEIKEFNIKHGYDGENIFELDKRDLLRLIDTLLHYNIIFMGVKPQCPRCGLRNWIQVDELRTNVICVGCKYEFIIDSEPKWYYKLNSLFEIGYSQMGLLPVISVLGDLMHDVSSSFLLVPSLELFDEHDNTLYREKNIKPKHEIDILCIKDGEFIIGEVKHSNKLFKKSDFTDMYDISIRIQPDKIIFASLDEKPSLSIESWIKELQLKLESSKIIVEWYYLSNDYFDPTLVR